MGGIGSPALQYPSVMSVFNPARYYAETNSPTVAPTQPGAAPAQLPMSTLLLLGAAVVLIWAVERRRLGLSIGGGLHAGAHD